MTTLDGQQRQEVYAIYYSMTPNASRGGGAGYQPSSPELDALSAISGHGNVARTATGLYVPRTFQPGAYTTVANGDGNTGDPSVDVNLTALYGPLDARYSTALPAAALPLMDGVAAVGVATKYGREDHVHPSDTSRQAASSELTGLAGLSATGLVARTGTGAYASRNVGAGNGVLVTNPDGVAGPPTVAADVATAAQIRSSTANKMVDAAGFWNTWSWINLTDAATVAIDFNTMANASLLFTSAVGATRQIGNPTNTNGGRRGYLEFIQDAAGSRVVTWGSNWKFAAGTPPVLTTAANARDYVEYICVSPTRIIVINVNKDVR